MTFAEVLNASMDRYALTTSALAAGAGVSKSTVSRYRNGRQTPAAGSGPLRRLASCLAARASETGEEKDAAQFLEQLERPLREKLADRQPIAANLDRLIQALGLNVNDLSRYLSFDASYLSRLRSGQRRPANPTKFCGDVADFVANRFQPEYGPALMRLTGCPEAEAASPAACRETVMNWLAAGGVREEDTLRHFLLCLDGFDLNEYIRAIRFDEFDEPNGIPAQLPASGSGAQDYYSIEGFMEAELLWLRKTLLADTTGSVFFYSDMPMEEMSKNPDFPKRWMTAVAMLLKRGLHLNIIHNVERSNYEMMLGLEGWIPLYMTGLVSPYYLKGYQDGFFRHFLRVSGAGALTGEAIAGFHGEGWYHLAGSREEIAYFQKRAARLLSRASPLMEIYRQDAAPAFHHFLLDVPGRGGGTRRSILPSPPLYTASGSLLDAILAHNDLTGPERRRILDWAAQSRAAFVARLSCGGIEDELMEFSREEFARYPVCLSLADLFFEKEIVYTYEEYQEHIRLTKGCAAEFPAYRCVFAGQQPFRNIQIRMEEGEYVILSKNKSPAIHFVIRHPGLRKAFEQMTLPMQEDAPGADRS